MAFTVRDFEDMLRILEEKPEWQQRMRQAILTRELLELPARFEQLVETVKELVEAQRRTDARVDALTATVAELVEAQRRTEAQVAELAEAQRRTDARVDALTATVAELVEAQRRTEAQVAELAEAQRRTEAQVAELAEAQRRTDARVDELAGIVQELVQISRDALRRLERLENWQQGETGRREGERYEREVVARAPALFYGGKGGGKGEPHVREQVGRWLMPLFRQGVDIDPQNDPLLADLIWWKGDRVMVVEVGLKLGVNDVRRAKARAQTLRQVGVDATPVVIGEEWGTPDTEATDYHRRRTCRLGGRHRGEARGAGLSDPGSGRTVPIAHRVPHRDALLLSSG
jgi:cell division protein FtsB